MPDFSIRATDPENLDLGVPADEALRSLGDLRLVNRWLGNRRRLLATVAPFLRDAPAPRLLDVGCGSGDLPCFFREALGGRLLAVGADVKLLHLQAAPSDLRRVVADVRRLPFAPHTFDVVTASLFLHHFDAADLPALLRSLFALARRALVINDLERSAVPYLFGRVTFPFLFQSRVSVEDGLISIRRGFRPPELRGAFVEAGLPQVRIRRHFPYRLLAVVERTGAG